MKRRDVEQMLARFGLELVRLTRNCHWKARVRRRDGSEATVTFPTSTSDHRAMKNKMSQLQNIASGAQ